MHQPTDEQRPAAEGQAAETEDPAVAELRERWQRALADADNTRKRCDRLVAERVAAERQRATAAWLPVLDNLDLALHHAKADPQAIVQGVSQVRDQAGEVLSKLGFEPVGRIGEPFDPSRHAAAEAVEDREAPAGTVVRVIRPGYAAGALMLRPAVVAVARAAPDDTQADQPDERVRVAAATRWRHRACEPATVANPRHLLHSRTILQ